MAGTSRAPKPPFPKLELQSRSVPARASRLRENHGPRDTQAGRQAGRQARSRIPASRRPPAIAREQVQMAAQIAIARACVASRSERPQRNPGTASLVLVFGILLKLRRERPRFRDRFHDASPRFALLTSNTPCMQLQVETNRR
jgi:hypothetical protein